MVSPRRLARREAKKAAKAAGLPPPKFKRGQPVPTPGEIWAQAGKTAPTGAPAGRRQATPAPAAPKPASDRLDDPADLLGSPPAAPTRRRRAKGAPTPDPAAQPAPSDLPAPPARRRKAAADEEADNLLGVEEEAALPTAEAVDQPEALGCYSSKGPPYHIIVVVQWGRKHVHYVPVSEPLTLKKQSVSDFKRYYTPKIPGKKQYTPESAARAILAQRHSSTEGARRALEALAGYDLI